MESLQRSEPPKTFLSTPVPNVSLLFRRLGMTRRQTSSHSNAWGTEPNATWYDLKQLAFAVFLFELVIAALALATRAFFGIRTALWVGLGIGTLVLVAFALVSAVGVLTSIAAAMLARRETRRGRDRPVPRA
jgi:nitrate reductase gamma subunit